MAVPDIDEDEFLTPEAEDASQKSSYDISSQKKALKSYIPEELVKPRTQAESEELQPDQNDKVPQTTKQSEIYSQSVPLKQESATSKLENKSNPISSSFCVYSVPMKSWNAQSNEIDNLKVQLTHSYPVNSLKMLNVDKLSLRTLCFPAGLLISTSAAVYEPQINIFTMTLEDYTQYYGVSLTIFEPIDPKLVKALVVQDDPNEESQKKSSNIFDLQFMLNSYVNTNRTIDQTKLAVSRSICSLSKTPKTQIQIEFLRSIFFLIAGGKDIEATVRDFVDGFHLPSHGSLSAFNFLDSQTLYSYRAPITKLPTSEHRLVSLFNFFSIESIMVLITSVLIENQIILISNSAYKLDMLASILRLLIFPFDWPHIYVPMLPVSLLHSLEAPVAFIIGVRGSDSLSIGAKSTNSLTRCIIDIDSGRVVSDDNVTELPVREQLSVKLLLIIEKYAKEGGLYKHAAKYQHEHVREKFEEVDFWSMSSAHLTKTDFMFNNEIQNAFFTGFANMFETYAKYIVWPTGSMQDYESKAISNDSSNFLNEGYLVHQPFENLPFLSLFVHTQMFSIFIDNKIQSVWGKTNMNNFIFDSILNNSSDLEFNKEVFENAPSVSKKLFIPPDFDQTVITRLKEKSLEFTLEKLDSCNFDDPNYTPSETAKSPPDDSEKMEENFDALNHTALAKKLASRDANIITGYLIDAKVRINQILVYKLDPNNFQNYVDDDKKLDEISLCYSVLEILRKICSYGVISPSKHSLWSMLTLYNDRSLKTLNYAVSPSDMQPRIIINGNSAIPESFCYVFQCILDMELNDDGLKEEAWLFLCLERKLLAKYLGMILEMSDIASILYHRWSLLRRHNDASHLVHHFMNLNQVNFDCFTKRFYSQKMFYRFHFVFTTENFTEKQPISVAMYNDDLKRVKFKFSNLIDEERLLQLKGIGNLVLLRMHAENLISARDAIFMQYVVIRNEYSGRCFMFVFNKYLSDDVGDCSRTLIAASTALPPDVVSVPILVDKCNEIFQQYKFNSILMQPVKKKKNSPALSKYVISPVMSYISTPDAYNLLNYDKAKLCLDQLSHSCSLVDQNSSKKDIVQLVFGQNGIFETFLFIFKYNFGQFAFVSFLSNITHPWHMLMQHALMIRKGQFKQIDCPITIKYAANSMSDIFVMIDEQELPLGLDEKLCIGMWVGLNQSYLVDYMEFLWITSTSSQYYKNLSFLRNIFLFDSLKRLVISIQRHILFTSGYFKSNFPYSTLLNTPDPDSA